MTILYQLFKNKQIKILQV